MVVGVLEIDLRLHGIHSLKGKRGQVKKMISRLRNQFQAAVAEVHSHDKWQRAGIGVSVVGNDASHVNACLDKILNAADGMGEAEIIDHRVEIITL